MVTGALEWLENLIVWCILYSAHKLGHARMIVVLSRYIDVCVLYIDAFGFVNLSWHMIPDDDR